MSGFNKNPEISGISNVVELPDILNPRVISGSIYLGNGHISLIFSETIDSTPASKVNFSKFYLANITGDEQIPLKESVVVKRRPDVRKLHGQRSRKGPSNINCIPERW